MADTAEEQIHQLEDQITELQHEVKALRTQLDSTLKKFKRAEREIERSENYNADLRKTVDDLSKQLHKFKVAKSSARNHFQCQVSEKDFPQEIQATEEHAADTVEATREAYTAEQLAIDAMKDGEKEQQQTEPMSIADSLKAAAESVVNQSGFVYDDTTGLYYDYNSGYYYDSENSLYYDANSGTYYFFDQESNSYQFHSQVDPAQFSQMQKYVQHRDDRHIKRKHKNKDKTDSKDNRLNEDDKSEIKISKKRKKHQISNDTVVEISSQGQSYKHANSNTHTKDNKDICESKNNTAITHDNKSKSRGRGRHHKENKANGDENNSENVKASDKNENDDENVKAKTMEENVKDNEENVKATDNVGEDSESDMEEGELSSSESEIDELSDESEPKEDESCPLLYPPCIRMIVQVSDTLDRGTLYILTYMGGTIGREKDMGHTVRIPDLNVSKMHAEVKYIEDWKKYGITDHASQNGTFVNNERISKPKVMGKPFPLSHRDELKIGGSTFLLHIHPGTETCDECEPGQIQAAQKLEQTKDFVVQSKTDRDLERKKQLKLIKKKFGLEKTAYDDSKAINNPAYKDKAGERRKKVGSENPFEKHEAPASVHREISEGNKGHRMLKKMGWASGEGLGKAQRGGITEPIKVVIRSKQSAGLGSGIGHSIDDIGSVQKSKNLTITQERFDKITKSEAVSSDSSNNSAFPKRQTFVKSETLVPMSEQESQPPDDGNQPIFD
ncbi:unnamed protein product [Owenia fusiformis]|uniref:Uncharacterized protein n=1 Tax=Owenia fusiformis TaxID=6347 RepID=A0A8J1XTY1_OWEFU|nr:unnamed protein product [Owenia fusiformis]